MPREPGELKRKLVEATRRFKQSDDIEEKAMLGADVRELEKSVENASDEGVDPPRKLIRSNTSSRRP